MNGKPWSERELEKLRELYPDHPTGEIAAKLGRSLFGVYGTAHKLGLKKTEAFLDSDHCRSLRKNNAAGSAYRFPAGHVPANKGLRRPGFHAGRMKETQFKKGCPPLNTMPVGTITPDADGYLRIKLREKLPSDRHGWDPNVWPAFHRHVWVQHKGPIPPKHIVVFKDGDRTNCAIDNLELISMADNARRNTMWARLPREVAEAIYMNGQLKRKIRRLSGEK